MPSPQAASKRGFAALPPWRRSAIVTKGHRTKAARRRAAELAQLPSPRTTAERNAQIQDLARTRRFTYPELGNHFGVSAARIHQIIKEDPYTWQQARKKPTSIERLVRTNDLYSDSMAGMAIGDLAAKYKISTGYVHELLRQ